MASARFAFAPRKTEARVARPQARQSAAGTGLRREEVAERAGIGIDWYIRLEQGRTVRPPQSTIDALARALQLNKTEHVHLRALARAPKRMPFQRETAPQPLRHLIESLNLPAYVTGRRWDVLAWNAAAQDVFPHFARTRDDERNSLLYFFADPDSHALFGDGWEENARRLLAQFRAAYDLWAGDPAFDDLLRRLQGGSPEFARWWKSHDIADLSRRKDSASS